MKKKTDCPKCGADKFYISNLKFRRIRAHKECCACGYVVQKGVWDRSYFKNWG